MSARGSRDAVAASRSHRYSVRIYRTTLFDSWFAALLVPADSLGGAAWFQRWCSLFDLVEGVPSEPTTGPAATTQHLAPVTLDDPIDLYEAPEMSGNTVVSIVAAKDRADFADLFTDRLMWYSLHELLQRRKAAP